MRKRIGALILTMAMLVSVFPTSVFASLTEGSKQWNETLFTDVTPAHWFYSSVQDVYKLGLMSGYGNGQFQPEGSVTLAETVTIACNIHATAADQKDTIAKTDPWYEGYVQYALANGILEEGLADYNRAATRLEFARIMARALPDEDLASVRDVPYGAIPDVKDDAAVYLLYRAGVLSGSDEKGTFYPDSNIKRSEVAAVAVHMALPETRSEEDIFCTDYRDGEGYLPNPNAKPIPDRDEDRDDEDEDDDDDHTSGGSGSGGFPFPTPGGDKDATVVVVVDDQGKVAQDATIEKDGSDVKATVPTGVAVEDGKTRLTLTVSPLDSTDSSVDVDDEEEASSYDVHVDGVSPDNEVAILVALGKILPNGMNLGNVTLYHIEASGSNAMTQVDTMDALDAHNEFYYDPVTGEVTVAMATFSEVAVVSDTEKAWEGKFDYTWYDADATELTIANADQLAAFGAIVGGMAKDEDGNYIYTTTNSDGEEIHYDTFADKTVKLLADVNLGDAEEENDADLIFYPIGYYNSTGSYEKVSGGSVTSSVNSFEGTFDGNGHTISNFYQNTWEMFGDYNSGYSGTPNHYKDAMGLFGYVVNGTVKNLTVDNFSSDGEFTPTGVIAAYAVNSTFENIALTNCNPRVYNTGNGGIVGIAGRENEAVEAITLKNITIDKTNKISALWGSWDVACGGLVGMYRGNVDGSGNATGDTISFESCRVAAQIDVYNDVCANYQYYAYRYAGMMIGSIRHNTKNDDGKTIPNMVGISATGCTVNYGDWNDYYYCEFEKNSMASYSEDYQFSRVDKSEIVFDENGDVIGCTHTHTDAEDKRAVYLPFHQLFTGYSWGVSSIGLEKYSGIVTDLDITEGEQNESVVKFETKFTGDFLYRVGNQNSVSIGSLFASAVENLSDEDGDGINDSGVWVTIDKVDEEMDVSGTFTANTSDWTQGTIKLEGTGVVKITIQDYDYCEPTELYLEVVDAVNATSATSATANNVVLLNDISSGFTVSGRYTVYGNGFALNYTGNGQYLNNGLKQGVVTVSENGTLDNLRIKATIYPAAYLYYGSTMLGDYVQGGPSTVEGDKTRYHYQLSAVAASGNATISNCYIYGGRNNIFVNTGDVTITDSVLECGTVANVQIQSTSSHTVTLNNVTTIQKQVNPTVGDTSKVMLGTGILVGPDTTENPTIVLDGEFKQYNWVTRDDVDAVSDEVAKIIINGAVDATEYNHTVNGKTASNLGIIYMNTVEAKVTNNTKLPYVLSDIAMTYAGNTIDGQVCSLQGATVEQIYSDYENADRTTVNGDYMPTFDFDLGDQEISYDGSEDTRYLYGDADGITALYQDGDTALTLDLSKLATVYKYTGLNYGYTAVCKDSSGNELTATNGVVTLSAQGSYTLEFTVEDNIFYDKNGSTINKSVERTFTVPLTLTVKEASIKNAVVNITKTALDGVYTTVNITDYKLRINFLDCISVTDYNNTGTGTTVDLTSNISSATLTPASVNVFTTASTVTITYTDGRVLTVNLSKISGSSAGTKTATVNTSGGVYFITDGALNNKPTEASSQNKCTITSVSFKGNSGSTVTNDTDVTVTWALGSSSGCFAEGTLITLADGTQKPIEEITYADELLAWDLNTGAYVATTPSLIESHEEGEYRIINLKFADDTMVRIIIDHGFFDVDENKFVFLEEDNIDSYIGHEFVRVDGDNYKKVKLVDYEVTTETVSYYTIQTAIYNNCVAESMFTLTSPPEGVDGWFDYFEIGDGMKYDKEKMQADIETYGLYTYEDFADYVTYEQFIAFNGPYLKVLVGKGVVTYDEILDLIATYVNPN